MGATVSLALASAASASAATLTEYSTSSVAQQITTGPDSNLWFTESGTRIGTITTSGTMNEYSAGLTSGAQLNGIATGPDGDVWFTEPNENKVGKIDPSTHAITEYSTGITAGADPSDIVAGPDGQMWFTEPGTDSVAKIDPSTHTVTEYGALAGITAGSAPTGITVGPDSNLWFTETSGNRIGTITTGGVAHEYSTGIHSGASPLGITAGADGNLWFAESGGSGTVRVGRITTAGAVSEFLAPFNATAPTRITSMGNDLIYAADSQSSTIGDFGRITQTGMIEKYSFPFDPNVNDVNPVGVTVGPDGNIWATTGDDIAKIVPDTAPSATTGTADSITSGSAALHGTVTCTGAATSYEFEYGPTSSYGHTTTNGGYPYTTGTGSCTGEQAESTTVHGLAAGTTYHFRMNVTNLDGSSSGSDQTFTTAAGAVAPTVFTGSADTVTSTSANLNATVNPNGGSTTYYFEWGTGPLYGHQTPTQGPLPVDSNTHFVFAALSGLPSGTLIHYRIDATNSAGTSYGSDRTLTTYTSVASGRPGAPDSSFGTGGETGLDFGSTTFSGFNAIARQSDGKLVMAGYSDQSGGPEWAVARLNTDGTPDSTFGSGGTVLVNVGGLSQSATGVAIQSDGKIVVAGASKVVRLNGDGSTDSSFGTSGVTSVGSMTIAAVAVQPSDQHIVLAGAQGGDFALARLNTDGSADTSFGTTGTITTAFGAGSAGANALKIQGDGEIVAAGFAGSGFAAARYNPDGSLDTGFGSAGLATPATPGSGSATATGVVLQADGKLVLAGSDTGGNADVVRLNNDGTVDSGFGTGPGTAFTVPGTSSTQVHGAALDYGGFVLVDGSAQMNGDQHGFIARLTPTGAIDTTFGQSGFDTFPDSAGLGGIVPPVAPPGDTAAPPGPDPPNTKDAGVAGQQVTARDPSGGTPTKTDGGTTVVDDSGPASCITGQGIQRAVPGSSVEETYTVTNCGYVTLTIQANGVVVTSQTTPGAWTLSSDSCSGQTLPPGASCQFVMKFTPQQLDPDAGTGEQADIEVLDSDGAVERTYAVGHGVPDARSCLSPSPLDFGTVGLGSAKTLTVTLSNCGTASLHIYGLVEGTAGDFRVTQFIRCYQTDLAPGASCTFTVQYAPSAIGASTETFYISDSGLDQPEQLPVKGNGEITPTCPSISVDSALDGAQFPIGKRFTGQFTATGGSGPYTYSVDPQPTADDELTIGPDGSVVGTPTRSHSWRFTVTATDSNGCTGSSTFTFQAVTASQIGGGTGTTPSGPCPIYSAFPRPCADWAITLEVLGVDSSQGLGPCVSAYLKVVNNGPDATAAKLTVNAPGSHVQPRYGNGFPDNYLQGGSFTRDEGRPVQGAILVCPKELPGPKGWFTLEDLNLPPVSVSFSAQVTAANDPVSKNNGPVSFTTEIPSAEIKGYILSRSTTAWQSVVDGVAGFFGSGKSGGALDVGDPMQARTASATPTDHLRHVELAVLRISPGARAAKSRAQCEWLADTSGHFRSVAPDGGGCAPSPVWLRANGLSRWSLNLGRLARGHYVVYARALDAHGLADTTFSAKSRNRIQFTVP